jgi:hypothetical protein
VLVVSELFHPSREDPMDNPAVFAEYARSESWTTVHLAQYFGFLLLLGGLVALYYSLGARPGLGAGLSPFGLASAVTAAACFTVLQGVDGIALKRAVDAWASAPADREAAAFAAAEAIRWTEIAMNSLSYSLLGLTLLLYGLAIALGGTYPRWAGLIDRVDVQRRGGGGLRGLRLVDHQAGGTASVGRVGVYHGVLDVARPTLTCRFADPNKGWLPGRLAIVPSRWGRTN